MKVKSIKIVIIGLFLLVCFVPFSVAARGVGVDAVSAPKLYNEGFNVLDQNGKFDNWEQSDNVSWVYTSKVKENVLKEDKCAFISGDSVADREFVTLKCVDSGDFRFSLSAGVAYVASINYFATQSATLIIKYAKSNTNTLYSESFEVGAGKWNKASVKFTPENDSPVKIRFEITNLVGDIYLDDAYLGIDGEPGALNIDYGAYLRLEKNSSGIRFRGKIDKNYLDKIKADSSKTDISYGILLTKTYPEPIDYTTPEEITADIFTVDELTAYNIPFILMEATKIYNGNSCDADGFYGFNCALINIKEENFKQSFSARTYLRYTENGSIVYEYSDYDEKANARSVEKMVEKAWAEKDIFTDKELLLLQEYRDRLSSLA